MFETLKYSEIDKRENIMIFKFLPRRLGKTLNYLLKQFKKIMKNNFVK